MIEFLKLGARLAGICLACYGAAVLPFRVAEFFVSRRASGARASFVRFCAGHFGSLFVTALITPAVCYVVVALIMRTFSLDPAQFTGSFWYWVTLWMSGLWIPVQSSYYVNGRLFSGQDMTVRPQWLMYYWSVNSSLGATLMWLPLWCGWVSL